ncbi:MAG: Ldh family oxidoreductase [Synergistetes bacterium]|nr:Ldh family oxidoreductase [Synergistota bacterium]
MAQKEWLEVRVDELKNVVKKVFMSLNVPEEHAEITADVLIEADKRGIDSHGVGRLKRYVDGIRTGMMIPGVEGVIVKETANTLTIDGQGGLGQVVAYKAMKKVIEKAEKNNVCFAAIRNSNHYGIAGYYAMMALERDMIGISLTNSTPLMVPTFGRNVFLGTNPISIAFPIEKGWPVVLDMATSTVPQGKLEVYRRMGKKIPLCWATDEFGNPCDDPGRVLDNMAARRGGGLLPLGGADEETGGHKGYGLSFVVDVLSGVLSGGIFGIHLYEEKGKPSGVGHFLGAMRIDAFIEPDVFKRNLSRFVEEIKAAEKRENCTRIYVPGEKEYEKAAEQKEKVKLYYKVVEEINAIASELGVDATLNPL